MGAKAPDAERRTNMNRKEVAGIINSTAGRWGITLKEDTKNTEWVYWGTYAEVTVTLMIDTNRTNYETGEIASKAVVNVNIARMGRTTSVNMLRAAAELKRVAEFAAEIERMGLECTEVRKMSA